MTNYLYRGKEFGFNCFHIANNMDLKIVKHDDKPVFKEEDFVIRWGTTGNLPQGPKVINRRTAIMETCDKGTFRAKVAKKGLAPLTWLNVEDFYKWCQDNDREISLVVRPRMHSRSEDLYFVKTNEELKGAIAKINGPYYISEYIKKDREVRVFVANGRIMVVAEKNPKGKNNKDMISWGCVEEGTLDYTDWQDWEEDICRVAIEAFNESKLHFAAVDIMVKDGKAYFLECNTAPEVWAYYGEKFAQVFKYMTNGGEDKRERIACVDYKNWKNCIHPAVSNKAVYEVPKAKKEAPAKIAPELAARIAARANAFGW